MNIVCKFDNNTLEMFKYVDKLIEKNYPIDHRDCMKQAVREFVPEYELVDIYTLYGVTYNEYIEDMSNSYLRYKSYKLGEMWRKAN